MIAITIGPIHRTYHLYRTTAPQAYDGFGTLTVYISSDDKQRYILIEQEHLAWQLGRYGSGLHGATEETDRSVERMFVTQLWERLTVPITTAHP